MLNWTKVVFSLRSNVWEKNIISNIELNKVIVFMVWSRVTLTIHDTIYYVQKVNACKNAQLPLSYVDFWAGKQMMILDNLGVSQRFCYKTFVCAIFLLKKNILRFYIFAKSSPRGTNHILHGKL